MKQFDEYSSTDYNENGRLDMQAQRSYLNGKTYAFSNLPLSSLIKSGVTLAELKFIIKEDYQKNFNDRDYQKYLKIRDRTLNILNIDFPEKKEWFLYLLKREQK